MPTPAYRIRICPTLRAGAYGGLFASYFALPEGVRWCARLGAGDWLAFAPETPTTGRGPVFVSLKAARNSGPARDTTLDIAEPDGTPLLVCPVVQSSAEPLAALTRSVLEVPFLDAPRVLELGILGKFAAAQIQKVPEPFTVLALVVVEIVVVALGLLAILVREAFASVVPEPCTWLVPEPFEALAALLPATTLCISEETCLLALYILEHFSG